MEQIPVFYRKRSGIYLIRNTVNGKCYVGSAVDIYNRWHGHLNRLKSGTHVNKKLLYSYRKYGIDAFSFEVLELCPKGRLEMQEQKWIDLLSPAFNIRQQAKTNLGLAPDQAIRQAISNTLKQRYAAGEIKAYAQDAKQIPVSVWQIDGKHVADCPSVTAAAKLLGYADNAQAFRVLNGKARYLGKWVLLPKGKPFDRVALEFVEAPTAQSNPVKHQSGRCFVSLTDCARILGISLKQARKTTQRL